MRGVVRTLVGFAMIGAGVLLCGWALYHLIRIGTCASGGPYVSARPCPPGTGTKVGAITGGILLTLIGAGVTPGLAIKGITWGLGFTVLGAAFFVGAFGPAADPGADPSIRWVAVLVGGMFILMGLPGFAGLLRVRGRMGDAGVLSAPRAPAAAPGSAPGFAPAPGFTPTPGAPGVVMMSGSPLGPAAARPAAAADDDPIDELERLAKLRAAGALTDAEFEAAKARILE